MTVILTIAHVVWLETVRKKDIYVLLVLLAALLLALVTLDAFGLGGAVRYVKDLGLAVAALFSWILTISLAARQIPTEEMRGTIFPLLAKPITRASLICGKWLGTWTVASTATAVFYLLVTAVVAFKHGAFGPLTLLQGLVLHLCALAVIAAITIALSTRMNHDAAAAISFVVTGAAAVIVPRVPEMLAHESGISATLLMILYNLLPHLEVFDMRKRLVHDFGPAAGSVVGMVMLYAVLLTFIILLFAWLGYRQKRFSRSNQM